MTPVFEVSGAELVFPGDRIVSLVPKYEDIAEELKLRHHPGQKFAADAFYYGIKSADLKPREGVETKKAMRAIKAILGCFGFTHEHKMAAVAWYMNEWFEPGFTWEKGDGPG